LPQKTVSKTRAPFPLCPANPYRQVQAKKISGFHWSLTIFCPL
jgi:hypothetical protein